MAKIYREIAINDMVGTVETAMRKVLDCWAELPPEMQDAVDQFRGQLEAAIDSVYVVKRALDTQIHDTEEDPDRTQ
jgi:type IV secretory pathway ATPase VirB11/archaellum biosynthesis ATPase